MTETEIQNILEKQHKFFQTGQTLPAAYRIEQLQKLKDSIIRHEPGPRNQPVLHKTEVSLSLL